MSLVQLITSTAKFSLPSSQAH